MPSVARRELEDVNANGYLWRILELRAFRDTKLAIDRARTIEDEPTGAMADLVNLTTHRLLKHKQQQRAQHDE